MTELTAAESLRLFGEIIRDQAGTVLNPVDVILPRVPETAGPIAALVLDHQHTLWIETTVTRERPEPTPEQLAVTTFYDRDEWWTAYRQLGTRDDWPDMVDWVRRGVYRPRTLPDIVLFLETPVLTPEELEEILGRFCRAPAPSAAWRTTWRDVIVPLLAPTARAKTGSRPPEGRRDRRWQPLHERKTSYEVTE